jgi:hypothetical protein
MLRQSALLGNTPRNFFKKIARTKKVVEDILWPMADFF